jgi:hypothetical protein
MREEYIKIKEFISFFVWKFCHSRLSGIFPKKKDSGPILDRARTRARMTIRRMAVSRE